MAFAAAIFPKSKASSTIGVKKSVVEISADPLPSAADYTPVAQTAVAVGIGLTAGFFSGLAGVGGGVVIVPASVLLLGLDQHTAQGTSLVAIIFTSVAGTIVNLRNQRVRPRDGLLAGMGGVVGSIAGSALALMIDGRTLSLVFGFLVLFVAVRSLYRTIRHRPAQSAD